jgi:putative Mg2+ transporter-C (MgtC) family protein
MPLTEWEALARVGLAGVLGAVVGLDRELKAKPAGVRTHMLVAMGAALFMSGGLLVYARAGGAAAGLRLDAVIGSIVTGVGFLGGGIILHVKERVGGVTTAAGVWVTAALGMLAGAGFFYLAAGGALLAAFVIALLLRLEDRLEGRPPGEVDVHRLRN